jgi:DNA polymerase-3 subunit epsilon
MDRGRAEKPRSRLSEGEKKKMREIVFDTETTGMDPAAGDRIVELGCIELVNQVPTGRTLHHYINPERDIPAEVSAIHGITDAMVKDKPVFAEIFAEFLELIGEDASLVAHNAEFDMKFINAELALVGHAPIHNKRVVDTLKIARLKFPGSPASLDALCRRFGIDNSARDFHGALLDSQLLAEVYLELKGGRQHGLGFADTAAAGAAAAAISAQAARAREFRPSRNFAPSAEELAAHEAMLAQLSHALWQELAEDDGEEAA